MLYIITNMCIYIHILEHSISETFPATPKSYTCVTSHNISQQNTKRRTSEHHLYKIVARVRNKQYRNFGCLMQHVGNNICKKELRELSVEGVQAAY